MFWISKFSFESVPSIKKSSILTPNPTTDESEGIQF